MGRSGANRQPGSRRQRLVNGHTRLAFAVTGDSVADATSVQSIGIVAWIKYLHFTIVYIGAVQVIDNLQTPTIRWMTVKFLHWCFRRRWSALHSRRLRDRNVRDGCSRRTALHGHCRWNLNTGTSLYWHSCYKQSP